jgi:hypothetical protein
LISAKERGQFECGAKNPGEKISAFLSTQTANIGANRTGASCEARRPGERASTQCTRTDVGPNPQHERLLMSQANNPHITNPFDVIPRLNALSVAAEIGVSPLDRKRMARDAAAEIGQLRRRIEGLTMRLDRLHGKRC